MAMNATSAHVALSFTTPGVTSAIPVPSSKREAGERRLESAASSGRLASPRNAI
jgi:hypothetical protein